MATFSGRSTKSADIRTWDGSVHDNDGAHTIIRNYYESSARIYYSLVEWDVSGATGGTVSGAGTATFYYDGATFSGTPTTRIYKVLRAWNEGDNTLSTADAGEVDWTDAQHGSVSWTTAGVGDTTDDRSGTEEDSKTHASGADWDATISQGTLQEWVDGTNNGIVIRIDAEGTEYIYFYSDDQAGTTSDPLLTFSYAEATTTSSSSSSSTSSSSSSTSSTSSSSSTSSTSSSSSTSSTSSSSSTSSTSSSSSTSSTSSSTSSTSSSSSTSSTSSSSSTSSTSSSSSTSSTSSSSSSSTSSTSSSTSTSSTSSSSSSSTSTTLPPYRHPHIDIVMDELNIDFVK